MRFLLLDDILEQSDDRIVAVKQVSLAEEYLKDHFATFPVLPGVFMLEAMVQAARIMLALRGDDRLVLGEVRALRYGTMVKPGETLLVEVSLSDAGEDGSYRCRGTGKRIRQGRSPAPADTGETAVSGKFTMRPLRVDSFDVNPRSTPPARQASLPPRPPPTNRRGMTL